MKRISVTTLLVGAALFSSVVLIAGATSGWLIGIAGFFFVVGGTLAAAAASDSLARVEGLLGRIPLVFFDQSPEPHRDEPAFLALAEYYRRGWVRRAETSIKEITDPLLRQGARMVVDRCSRKELERALLWRIAEAKEAWKRRLRMLHSMAGFAPAFGMLGTLLGLVRLLFSLGGSSLEVVGAAMGFAMITTVYGLVAANLVIKPIAIKMEQQSRELLAWQQVKYELLLMLFEKEHPRVIRNTLHSFHPSPKGSREAPQSPPAPINLARKLSDYG